MGAKQAEESSSTVVIRGDGIEVTAEVRGGVVVVPKAFAAKRATVGRRKQGPKQSTAVNLGGLKDSGDYGPQATTRRLVAALGNNAVAALLGVNKDRPSRWASGADLPNEENRQQLADLDSLMGHLLAAFTPAQARLWLEGQDPNLGGRPIDVYRTEGAPPVIEAIRAYEQGAFA